MVIGNTNRFIITLSLLTLERLGSRASWLNSARCLISGDCVRLLFKCFCFVWSKQFYHNMDKMSVKFLT